MGVPWAGLGGVGHGSGGRGRGRRTWVGQPDYNQVIGEYVGGLDDGLMSPRTIINFPITYCLIYYYYFSSG